MDTTTVEQRRSFEFHWKAAPKLATRRAPQFGGFSFSNSDWPRQGSAPPATRTLESILRFCLLLRRHLHFSASAADEDFNFFDIVQFALAIELKS
jgi:hypothetical protein